MKIQITDEALFQSEIVTALVVSRVNAELQVEQLQAALKSEKDEHHKTLKKVDELTVLAEKQRLANRSLVDKLNEQFKEEKTDEEAFFDRDNAAGHVVSDCPDGRQDA